MSYQGRKLVHGKQDRLRQLRAFCQAARFHSFTKAADHLDLTPPAVALHVRSLENELEVSLFERCGARLRLTRAGEILLDLVGSTVEDMDAIGSSLRYRIEDIEEEEVRLAATPGIAAGILPTVLGRYRQRYPKVELSVKNCLFVRAIDELLAGDVEFVVGMRAVIPEATVEFRALGTYDLILVTPQDHPLAGRSTVAPEEIAAHPAVMPSPGLYTTYYRQSPIEQLGLEGNIAIESGGWTTTKSFVEAGFGVALIPDICVMEQDRLSVVPLKYFRSRRYGLYTKRGAAISPAAERLIQLMDTGLPCRR